MILVDKGNIPPAKKDEEKEVRNAADVHWQGRAILILGVAAATVILAVAAYEMSLLVYEIAHDKIWKPDLAELEAKIKTKFKEEVVSKFKNLEGIDTTRLFKRLALCKEEEQEILTSLVDRFHLSDDQLKEIMMGAHVRLADDGHLFEEWSKKIQDKQSRISSHPSDSVQYGIRGPLVKELLFSRVKEKGKVYTWFQLENHPVTFGHIIRHMIDFFKYKIFNENQGPDGSSKATHHNPIIIMSKNTVGV